MKTEIRYSLEWPFTFRTIDEACAGTVGTVLVFEITIKELGHYQQKTVVESVPPPPQMAREVDGQEDDEGEGRRGYFK